mmetsp:Transcript_19182/g.47956  ORF Transcript_19182/g.47956 Transcript_19182/m.47956 type:complete len:204 (+) Transcript_19182:787-1398(+)
MQVEIRAVSVLRCFLCCSSNTCSGRCTSVRRPPATRPCAKAFSSEADEAAAFSFSKTLPSSSRVFIFVFMPGGFSGRSESDAGSLRGGRSELPAAVDLLAEEGGSTAAEAVGLGNSLSAVAAGLVFVLPMLAEESAVFSLSALLSSRPSPSPLLLVVLPPAASSPWAKNEVRCSLLVSVKRNPSPKRLTTFSAPTPAGSFNLL